ncbi:hypothetical protein I6G82_00815 [Lysinibacillus macroides]|uniref:Uncharacterized protein n=1 Tax=Lysinibacillus macroides TaxID=33935 RepID=A0A0M9DKC2_9BACI|nr:hypothetical protein [Lysinibacillus macroides]KOY82170.1 hypothetical protein ADM90_11050 [Lysinibacillus macroides]QPR68251.1 hypothetical protein I6G82_00815 [Lysinibacillus macroides]
MGDNLLIAKLSSLLEEEDPLVNDLILETVKQVDKKKTLSVEAHAKKIERVLDNKLSQIGG